MPFKSLGLSAELHRAVSEKGYSQPTPIQIQAIPLILEGRDIMGGAQTGTGKTAGFTLPVLQRIIDMNKSENSHRAIRALVLTPTRELAAQVAESVHTYGRYLPLRSAVVHGGVNIRPQIQKIRKGLDILVATPGRLLDHVQQKTVDLSKVDILVLDEADRMLDMGFIRDIRKIIACLPKHRQTLLFSATFTAEVKKLAENLLQSPTLIEVAKQNATADKITQMVHLVDKNRKRDLLSSMIGTNNWQQVLVFTRTKRGADRLCKQLTTDGITASAIHGDKSQGARSRALAEFKKGKVRVLVATDIAARGLDINQLPHVINYELPNIAEDYVHRIGRTGRAGNEGEAISLVCSEEIDSLKAIERLVKRELPQFVLDGFQPAPAITAHAENRNRTNNRPAGNRPGKKPKSRWHQKRNTGNRPSGNNKPSGNRKQRGR